MAVHYRCAFYIIAVHYNSHYFNRCVLIDCPALPKSAPTLDGNFLPNWVINLSIYTFPTFEFFTLSNLIYVKFYVKITS